MSAAPAPRTVTAEVGLRLVVSREASIPLAASFRYAADDPYAVVAAFRAGGPGPVEWTFARELLADGARHAAGDGDVMVWPVEDSAGQVLAIALSSPSGHALFEAPAASIGAFLARTYDLVPQGAESGHVDAELCALLEAGGNPW
ncbi:MAG TPA: SsgA family sporulation/cell division regulator [Trebonia sp.]|nr:SsgA family sporulation/cell division regulator [Trebonia sp.]